MKKLIYFAVSCMLLLATTTQADIIDLSGFSHGDLVGNVGGVGITVESNGPYTRSEAMIFNSNRASHPDDPDLLFQGGWASGNISGEDLGNLLIIPNNNSGNVNDEASGGSITFDFSNSPIFNFRLDYVDFEESNLNTNFLTFTSVGGSTETLSLGELEPLFGAFSFDDRSANRIKEITLADLDFDGSDLIGQVEVMFPGSGGITTVSSNVPIPGAVWLLGSGLLGLVGLRARRKK